MIVVNRTNRHPNPFARSSLAGWSTTVRAVTSAAVTYGGVPGMESTVSGTGTTHVTVWTQPTSSMTVTAGETLPVSVQVRVSRAGQVQAQLEWRTGGGTLTYTATAWVSCAAGTVTTLTLSPVVPAGIATARLVVTANGTSLTTGDLLWVGGALIGSTGTPFDGDTAPVGSLTYVWSGTAYASASNEMIPVPISFDIVTTDDPPSADIAVMYLPAGTVSIRVTRMWRGVASRPRGDDFATVVGDSARIVDYDIPTSTNVVYKVDAIDASGAVLETALSPTVNVDHGDPNTIWLSDPLAPPLTTRLAVYRPTDESRSYPAQIDAIYAMGDGTPYAQGSGARSSARDWQWVIKAPDRATSDRLDDLLESGNVLVVRPHPDAIRHRTGVIFLAIPDVAEQPGHERHDRADLWLLTGAFEAQDARLPVVMVEHDYGAAAGEAANYGAYAALYANYLAAARG